MESIDDKIQKLQDQIKYASQHLDGLRSDLLQAERTKSSRASSAIDNEQALGYGNGIDSSSQGRILSLEEYERYGRQMILPQIGIEGQHALKKSRVLIIGLGGLGCPAAMYLAGAGVGTIGLVDGDEVELSNLHRQILHTKDRIGWKKVTSAVYGLTAINSNVEYISHAHQIASNNAMSIIRDNAYDLILDCTDHPTSRYLISDAAVIADVPLISASALKTEGQLLLLNYPDYSPSSKAVERGPCYRCLFPQPPPAASIETCGEGGILGPVVGLMGVMMATEAIRLLTTRRDSAAWSDLQERANRMLLYSAYADVQFRSVRLRGKRLDCRSCRKQEPEITEQRLQSGLVDYIAFCGRRSRAVLDQDSRLSPQAFKDRLKSADSSTIIDVRPSVEYDIAHLPASINIPFRNIQDDPNSLQPYLNSGVIGQEDMNHTGTRVSQLIFVCKYGNDSQEAAILARNTAASDHIRMQTKEAGHSIMDLRGGLEAWRQEVDTTFPKY